LPLGTSSYPCSILSDNIIKGLKMINLRQALIDPASIFVSPPEILLNRELSRDQKIFILKRWESDMREILVAEEENMQGEDVIQTFEAIRKALRTLDAKINTEDAPPTKQGG
jgi:hypothetical protein